MMGACHKCLFPLRFTRLFHIGILGLGMDKLFFRMKLFLLFASLVAFSDCFAMKGSETSFVNSGVFVTHNVQKVRPMKPYEYARCSIFNFVNEVAKSYGDFLDEATKNIGPCLDDTLDDVTKNRISEKMKITPKLFLDRKQPVLEKLQETLVLCVENGLISHEWACSIKEFLLKRMLEYYLNFVEHNRDKIDVCSTESSSLSDCSFSSMSSLSNSFSKNINRKQSSRSEISPAMPYNDHFSALVLKQKSMLLPNADVNSASDFWQKINS